MDPVTEQATRTVAETSPFVLASVMGGVFAIANGLMRLLERMLSKIGNGNGNGNGFFRAHEDLRTLHNDIQQCGGKLDTLVNSVSGFERSHDELRGGINQLVKSQHKMQEQFTVFMVKFTQHLEDFKCLGVRGNNQGG